MKDTELFQLALSLMPPWMVERCAFDVSLKRLDLYIDFERGGVFPCPVCGKAGCKAYDTEEKTWRHLNFFEHETYLHAFVPRLQCPDCGIKTAAVPWARPGSGFTLLFEALVLALAKEMPVKAVAALVHEYDTRIWRILHYHVNEARAREDFSTVRRMGMDETSRKKGHRYVSFFVDMDRSKLLFGTPGKDAATVEAFARDLKAHGGDPAQIREVSLDMSHALIQGAREHLPNAQITFDKFHAVKLVNDALEEVRREEQKSHHELKSSRYLWLRNPTNLKRDQRERLAVLLGQSRLKTGRAYRIKLAFQDLYTQPVHTARAYLGRWTFWATHSRMAPIIKVARTVKAHSDGILRWFHSGLTNAVLEAINSLIQAAKAKARGYRSPQYLLTIAYLIAGQLTFNLPT